ncbi:hypothetical protein BJV82DRAFT_581690 [Fennellomyces sp. T-0311]|nr:hypothetical protein BJV82DRAFT_581690 [Fennellomyces sp. T-0311]
MQEPHTLLYLKTHHGFKFEILDFFKHFSFTEELDAITEFKTCIEKLARSKHQGAHWARDIQRTSYRILRSGDVKKYWNDLAVRISNDELDSEVMQAKNTYFKFFLDKHFKNAGSNKRPKGNQQVSGGHSRQTQGEGDIESDGGDSQPGQEQYEQQADKESTGPAEAINDAERLISWLHDYQRLTTGDEKMTFLVEKLGSDDCLDLCSVKLSSYYKQLIQRSIDFLKFRYMLTVKEAYVLSYVHHCMSIDQLKALRQLLYQYDDLADGLEYIRMAVDHIISLWKSNKMLKRNQEGWWRQFLYTPLFDNAFLQMESFDIKRAERMSTVVWCMYLITDTNLPQL